MKKSKVKFKNSFVSISLSLSAILIAVAILILAVTKSYLMIKSNKVGQVNIQDSVATLEIEPQRAKPEIISTDGWDLEKVNVVYDSTGTPVPVPKGFVGSHVTGENTIDTGFVIYETEEEVNDENVEVMQKTKNQFVWIPIYYPEDLYGRTANGIAMGKIYTFSGTGRTKLNWAMNYNGEMYIVDSTSGKYDPDKNTDSNFLPKYLSEEGKAFNLNFESMVNSVEKYGGFFIGRYETCERNENGAYIVKANKVLASQDFFTMRTICNNISSNNNVFVEMIYGCQYDAVLEWLVNTGNKTYEEIAVDSSGWSNFTMNRQSGYSEVWKANNIYDLAGNLWEMTQEHNYEKYSGATSLHSIRGGSYYSLGSNGKASTRVSSYKNTAYSYTASRATLLISID